MSSRARPYVDGAHTGMLDDDGAGTASCEISTRHGGASMGVSRRRVRREGEYVCGSMYMVEEETVQ